MSLFVILEGNTESKGGYDVISSDCMSVRSGCDHPRCGTKLRCVNDANINNVRNVHNINSVKNAIFSYSSRKEESPGRHIFL